MARARLPENMIAVLPQRMAYRGPLHGSRRLLGGYALYTSLDEPFSVFHGGTWHEESRLAVVPPYTQHSLGRRVDLHCLLIEAESVSDEHMREERWKNDEDHWVRRIAKGFLAWEQHSPALVERSFDLNFLGHDLPARGVDERLARLIDSICACPESLQGATDAIADAVGLSSSRLRHMFRDQVGVSIRSFRAWKRLRNSIPMAVEEDNMLDLAMAAGYADASHLNHSWKQYFGSQPRQVRTHWRTLSFFAAPDLRGTTASPC